MNWLEEVEKRKDQLLKDTQEFLKIKSVLDEENSEVSAPFGRGIKEALDFALAKSESFGFTVKNVDGYAGHAEIGEGDELVGILCHVDVVPEASGWTSPPYAAEIRDGKIFARGALDDKGPTMAVIYAMRIIKELNLKLNKRVRIILGTDEESGWRGIDYYFEKEEMPTFGFAPDADFPIIITEKGIVNLNLESNITPASDTGGKGKIVSFNAGSRPNMVPDDAVVKISGEKGNLDKIQSEFKTFLQAYQYGGEFEAEGNDLTLSLKGISVHGMEPYKGVNAGLELIHFLLSVEQWLFIEDWMKWADKYLYQDYYGEKLGIRFEDDISGFLTVNTGVLSMIENKITIKINIRYPVTDSLDDILKNIEKIAVEADLKVYVKESHKPHHVEKDHFLVKTLKRVYEKQTGTEAVLLAIGGGTYARALNTGVAFGPLFPGKKETAHQKDEYIEIEDLLKAAAIYAEAIYELAK